MRTNTLIAFLLSLVGLTACGKKFITLNPLSNESTNTFYKTASDFMQATNACYNALQSTNTYGSTYYYLMEVRSDNTDIFDIGANAGIADAVNKFTELTTSTYLSNGYAGSYVAIAQANLVLTQIDASAIDTASKNQYKGECLFIRALSYFNLVRLFGRVPLVTTVETAQQALQDKRDSVASIYQQIITDLSTAANLLPAQYPSSELGRATSGAANTLLGKVYLTLQQWPNAVATLQRVMGAYTLDTSYANLFNAATQNQSPEMIFAVRYEEGQSPSTGNGYFNDMMPLSGIYINGFTGTGSGNNRPTHDMAHAYEAGDKRFAASMDTVYFTSATATTETVGNFVKKYADPPDRANDAGNSFPVLRYADVLLMMSEALNEEGYDGSGSGNAWIYLNDVRARAGLPAKTPVDLPTQDAFRDWIFKERRVELAFENHRWFDLIRYAKGLQIMQAHFLSEYGLTTPTFDSHFLVFAIPQQEIDVHDNPTTFPQNPGY